MPSLPSPSEQRLTQLVNTSTADSLQFETHYDPTLQQWQAKVYLRFLGSWLSGSAQAPLRSQAETNAALHVEEQMQSQLNASQQQNLTQTGPGEQH